MVTLTEQQNDRFQNHVGFDNVPSGEATKNNTLSLTLNVRHKGYQARRRSRSFMVGVDENSYSDYAIQWLLDELVDDGDEIICVRVIEKEIRYNDKQYQDDAQNVMQSVLAKNCANRAISFVLEYAVGKLHATFQKLVSDAMSSIHAAILRFQRERLTRDRAGLHVLDSNVPASNAHCWYERSLVGWHSGPSQLSQLLLQILPAILTRPRCRCATDGEADQKEGQARQ